MVHRIVVEDQSLRWYGRPPKIADDSIEFVQLQFHLPEDWASLVLVAQFTQTDTYNVLLDKDTCFLPLELMHGLCKISLFGYAEGKPVRATSIPLVFQIEESGFVSSAETPIPPTPDLYAQLIEYFSSITGSGGKVAYNEEQKLTDEQKELARKNIGAQPVGNYLTEVPEGYAKTTDIPTKPEDIGAQPSGDYALRSEIPNIPVQSVNGKTGMVQLSASDVGARPDNWMPTANQIGADPMGTASTAVTKHNTSKDSHNDIRLELRDINNRLMAFFDSDEQTLDELSEIVAYITSNKALIDSITTSKVSVADIIDNLTTNVSSKPLSAAQGVILKGMIDTISSNLSNYQPKGDYLTPADKPGIIQDVLSQLPGGLINTASGNPIVLDDSADKQPLNLLKLYGRTTQSGTPSPDAPVPLVSASDGGSVGVTVMGRNLFNWLPLADGALGTSNGTLVETGNNYIILQGKDGDGSGDKSYSNGWYQPGYNTTGQTKRVFLNKGDIVTISADYTMLEYGYGSAFNIGLHLYSDGKTMGNGFDNVPVGVKTNVRRTFTISESNAYYPVFSLNSGKVRIENIQIEYGTAVTAYEPYKASQTLTVPTPNGLPGIPVTSGGNYTDSTGQRWVCDEMDFDRGVYVQRVKKVVFDGSEKWTFSSSFNAPFGIRIENLASCTNTDVMLLCDKYPAIAIDETWTKYDYLVSKQSATTPKIYFRNTNVSTLDDWQTALKEKPVTLQYILVTPIETPLSDIDLSALHTHYPNTTVFNDAGAGMKVQYVADTKRYIDNKFNELATALVNTA